MGFNTFALQPIWVYNVLTFPLWFALLFNGYWLLIWSNGLPYTWPWGILGSPSMLHRTLFRNQLGFSGFACESSSQWHIDSALVFSNDASLPNMGSTNSAYDFSMIPVGSLQDPLMDFKGFPWDSTRVLQGCQYGIFESSRIHLGFPWRFPQFVDLISLISLRISKGSPWARFISFQSTM